MTLNLHKIRARNASHREIHFIIEKKIVSKDKLGSLFLSPCYFFLCPLVFIISIIAFLVYISDYICILYIQTAFLFLGVFYSESSVRITIPPLYSIIYKK